MTIQERILQVIENKEITPYRFCKDLGLSMGYLDKRGSIGTDKYLKIIEYLPEINPEWLLTGKGSMLKSEPQPAVSSPQPQENDKYISSLEKQISLLEKNNALQERENAYLSEKIKNLQEELKQHKKTAQSTMPDVLHQSTR